MQSTFFRCRRCGAVPLRRFDEAVFDYYRPFCSYRCEEAHDIKETIRLLGQ